MNPEANDIKNRVRLFELILYGFVMLVVFLLGTLEVKS